MNTLIAVYGTLRYGAVSNHLLRGCRRVGLDKINGKLYSLGAFPGVKIGPVGSGEVIVDVYEIPEGHVEQVMSQLDRYEGYHKGNPSQSLYVRFKVVTEKGKTCWVYEYRHPVDSSRLIESGDWLSV